MTNWKWIKSQDRDKRYSKYGFLVCKAASKYFQYLAISKCSIFQFAQEMKLVEKGKNKIKLSEYGRAVSIDSPEPKDTTKPFEAYNPDDIVQKTLIRQITKTFDIASAMALKQTLIKTTVSTSLLNKLISNGNRWTDIEAIIGLVSGYMRFCVEPYEGHYHIGIGGVKFLQAIKSHYRFIQWKNYLREGDVLFLSEIGSIDNIRWIECNESAFHKNEAVIFGDEGLLFYEERPLELRFCKSIVGWYGLMSFSGSKNVVHIPPRAKRWGIQML